MGPVMLDRDRQRGAAVSVQPSMKFDDDRWDVPSPSPLPRPPVADEAEATRLQGQNAQILALLEKRPASNDELSRIARKYTGRLSEIRAWLKPQGKTIVIVDRNHGTGLVVYAIGPLEAE